MALETKQSQVRSTYTNTAEGYELNYTTYRDEGENAKDISAWAKKDGNRACTATFSANGRKSFIVDEGVPDETAKALFSAVTDDCANIFGQINKTE